MALALVLLLAVAAALHEIFALVSAFLCPDEASERSMCALQVRNSRMRASAHHSEYGDACTQNSHCETSYEIGESLGSQHVLLVHHPSRRDQMRPEWYAEP